jgi:RimJ/RimL family protein N-acetyltransferase
MSGVAFRDLESSRLSLRRLGHADLSAFLAYRNDPEVAQYQSWESVSEQEAEALFLEQATLQPGLPGQWFQFAIELKETARLIGDCALKVSERDARQAEIGFTLSTDHQGQGFALEAVSCMLDFAFIRLGLHRVVAVTDCRNAQAVRLLERLGLRREGHFLQNVWFKGAWGDEYLYAVLKQEWLESRTGRRRRHGS